MDNWLAHYGISGQKWGVRRFQNLDRTRTEEGKLRYRESIGRKFDEAEEDVKKRSSNRYSRFKSKPVDRDIVKKRGNLSDREAARCSIIARDLFERASGVEPDITRDVISCVAQSGGTMFGLENRLKQPTSLAAKIGQEATENNVSFEEAAKSIKDAIRYTSVSSDRGFVKAYDGTKERLERLGYREVRCRNYFEMYANGTVQHKSVTTVYMDSDGNLFEIQFHTPSSQAAKELKIPLYEEARRSGISEKRKADIEMQMHDLAERVSDPKGVMDIISHG